MSYFFNTKFKLVTLVVAAMFAGGLFIGGEAKALSCEDDDAPCVSVSFGTPQGGNLSVRPGLAYYDSTQFYLPVEIGLKNASIYTVKVYGSGSSLVSGEESIPTIGTDTAYADLGKNGSEWGIRWNFGDTVEDKDTNYHKVPASSADDASVVVANEPLRAGFSTVVKKQLTLGFAVAVGANQPSGSYANTITVAVVASPRDARSFFDISTMQEMTPEICGNTTTPDKTATGKFDADGLHPEDSEYIPRTTLTDTRDGKQYTVLKLADGNCWMNQNLSLALSTSKALTAEDTDLNSKASWTPTRDTETSGGTKWGANDNVPRSLSVGWNQYWAGGTTFNSAGNSNYGDTSGYAQRGMYYNWFAATAGSGKSTDVYATTDGNRIINGVVQDSICPKGWTLPVGGVTAVNITDGSVKSFYNLIQLYTGNTGNFSGNVLSLYISPIRFVATGYYDWNGAQVGGLGERQTVNSSTAYSSNSDSSYNLNFYNGMIAPGTYSHTKGQGLSIRCVSR